MLDSSRVVHEAFATYAAVSIVAVHHPAAESLLAPYRDYERLYRSVATLTADAAGPHRRYLLATALARVSMQTPVLNALLASTDLTVTPSELAAIDRPDARWGWLTRASPALSSAAAAAADDRVATELGTDALEADVADPRAASAVTADFDDHWELWEHTAYQTLAHALGDAGATVLTFNGHIEPSAEAVRRARALDPGIPLRAGHPHSPAPDDAQLSAATIQFVRLNLVQTPRRARLAPLAADEAATRPLTPPAIGPGDDTSKPLVLHVRLPRAYSTATAGQHPTPTSSPPPRNRSSRYARSSPGTAKAPSLICDCPHRTCSPSLGRRPQMAPR